MLDRACVIYERRVALRGLDACRGAVRAGDWKLIEFFEDDRVELYNLREDIGETKNLATAQPAKRQELYAKLLAWRAATKAPMPTKNTGTAAAATDATKKKGQGKRKAAK